MKLYLKKILTTANRQFDSLGLLEDLIYSIKIRRLHNDWKRHYVCSLPEMEIIKKLINPNDTVFDIGANIGEFSFFLSTLISNGLIFAFEPQNKPFKLLRSLSKNIKTVVPNNFGFSNKSGRATLFIPIINGSVSRAEASMDPLFNDFSGYEKIFKSSYSLEESIQLTTLDEFCEKNISDRVDFIKIDVEGHELEILHGGHNVCLSKYRPILFIEIFPYVHEGHFEKVLTYMKENDYIGFVLSNNHAFLNHLTKDNLGNSTGFNYFFVPGEKINNFLYRIEREARCDSCR